MRWTPSKDGELRADLRIAFRVDRSALVLAAMVELAYDHEVGSRSGLEAALRTLLRRLGDGWPFAAERLDLEDAEHDALTTRAEAIVDRLYPEASQ